MMQIFDKAPVWVWPLLMVLIALGLRMRHAREVSPKVAVMISCVMLCLSAYGVIAAFNAAVLALITWLGTLSMALALCQRIGYPSGWRFDAHTARIHIPGSNVPLVLFLSIFLIKFAVGVALSMRPALALLPTFALPISAAYGLLSGIFAARALCALRLRHAAPALS